MENRGRHVVTDPQACRGLRLALNVIACWAFLHGEVVQGQEAAHASGHDALSRRVEGVIAAPGFQFGHWGILVVDRKTGQTIYERNADLLFAPASVTKLFSTAAALVELGPNYRFQTPLVRRGEIDAEGTLHGDVILIAQGDLAMGGRTGPEGRLVFQDDDHTYTGGHLHGQVVPTDPLAGLEHIAREVKAAGICEITGDVLIDDRLFVPTQSTGSGPRMVSPIVINDNVIDVFAQPAARAGEPAVVTFQPATKFVTMDAQVATVRPGVSPTLRSARSARGGLPCAAGCRSATHVSSRSMTSMNRPHLPARS